MPKAPFMPRNSIGWIAWLLLVYYAVSLGATLISDFSLTKKLLSLPISALFLWLWFRQFHFERAGEEKAEIINVLLMSALGFVLAHAFPALSICMLIYANCMAGTLHVRRGAMLIVFNLLLLLAAVFILSLEPWFWRQVLIISIGSGFSTLAFCEGARKQEALLKSQEEIEHLSKIAERERIARDLHDVLGHSMSLVALKAGLARKLLERDPTAALSEVRDIEQISRDSLAEIRVAITGYRSAGLDFELEQSKKMLEAAGVEAEFCAEPMPLPPAQENVVCMALREATTNTVRHARASRCRIAVVRLASAVRFSLEDNGCGGEVKFGNGLRGMQERAAVLGGHIGLEPLAPGLRLTVELPL